MQEKQRGSFYGLGIIISKRNGKITVITPLEGSPADRLGIRAGDIIDRVEGQPIDDLPGRRRRQEAQGTRRGRRSASRSSGPASPSRSR